MEDFDLYELAKLFDAALASDNPAVKKAVRNLMMVASIVCTQDENDEITSKGPFEKLTIRLDLLESEIQLLKIKRQDDYYKTYTTLPPNTWSGFGGGGGTWTTTNYNTKNSPTTEKEIASLMNELLSNDTK